MEVQMIKKMVQYGNSAAIIILFKINKKHDKPLEKLP
jgi:hypothetical protein